MGLFSEIHIHEFFMVGILPFMVNLKTCSFHLTLACQCQMWSVVDKSNKCYYLCSIKFIIPLFIWFNFLGFKLIKKIIWLIINISDINCLWLIFSYLWSWKIFRHLFINEIYLKILYWKYILLRLQLDYKCRMNVCIVPLNFFLFVPSNKNPIFSLLSMF